MKRTLETSNLDNAFVDFTDQSEYADSNFTIIASNGKKVHTTRQLLRIHSEYFRRYLSTSMRERGRDHSECPDYDHETVNLLINYMLYAGRANTYPLVKFADMRKVDIAKLLHCADFLGVAGVSQCVDAELSTTKPADLIKYVEIASTYNMHRTVEVIARDGQVPHTLLTNKHIPFNVVRDVASKHYARKTFADIHVKEHLEFIDKWIEADKASRAGYVEPLIESVDTDMKKGAFRKTVIALLAKYADDSTFGRFARKHLA